ncbi:rhodanese-like domain-containing protein [Oceanimonas pelagia]|uniref:Rhodanese-like domain-containing protein n=1 Tax=Oceanimonas pelagia TaxID=3028314 RepID=A0AA50KLL9_9GAMM|nr:rhodanese-like domain-containing protein [Oceanimonas pelagia]WMC09321.1 rhodanese-like domain-containing protein [Oceanimonas pelagia]
MKILIATLLLTLATPLPAAERAHTEHGPVWIDVRTVEEYRQDHLPGAVLIPHTHIARGVTERYPDRHTAINLYGQDGRRSRMAMEALQALGYSRVADLGSLHHIRGQQPEPALQPTGYSAHGE